MIDPRAFLRTKRDRGRHEPDDVRAFVAAFERGDVGDDQVGAWLMAAYLHGLDDAETDALTSGLLHSGRVFDWSALGRPTADKHSTGGVGDKISLPLAPMVAACGVLVPMVSGRGLGHTGGTLDKLEAIPGFRTTLEPDAMRAQLDRIGIVMVGQGPDLAPADGKLYAMRDVTQTVEREYFIVPSIVSKKIAEGAKAIAYDVKCGNGAFMKTPEAARSLAQRLVRTTRAMGSAAEALVTSMDQPLGVCVGNALEVRESVEVLKGGGPPDVVELTLELGATMLRLAGAAADAATARAQCVRAIASGSAWERMLAMVEAQGGDPRALEDDAPGLARAPRVVPVRAVRAGVLERVDCFALGELMVAIGAGRRVKSDAIDPAVGMRVLRRVGDRVEAGEALAELHLGRSDSGAEQRALACFEVGDGPAAAGALVLERIG